MEKMIYITLTDTVIFGVTTNDELFIQDDKSGQHITLDKATKENLVELIKSLERIKIHLKAAK